jgi:hypothetical protein
MSILLEKRGWKKAMIMCDVELLLSTFFFHFSLITFLQMKENSSLFFVPDILYLLYMVSNFSIRLIFVTKTISLWYNSTVMCDSYPIIFPFHESQIQAHKIKFKH